MTILFIVLLYLFSVLSLALFACWIVSPRRTRLRFYFSNVYWHYSAFYKRFPSSGYCAHSPQVWPWWRLMSFRVVRLEICAPSFGYRAWFYTRWGACYFDAIFDRRQKFPCVGWASNYDVHTDERRKDYTK